MYLLDTNVIINFLDASLSPIAIVSLSNVIDEQCNVSIISKMETLGYNFKTVSEQNTMETFINGSAILEINNEVVN